MLTNDTNFGSVKYMYTILDLNISDTLTSRPISAD